ncbi:hypothetical protein [Ancylobacter rudongensis]|uniref:Uncharacterized protein n=1 Tax=Ancylobacter rudongensis TaxID=177413 RepID=A0A1G4URC1_9HYPH|nr:hypothetical protein [Ancylobacter rudongensis]SCW95505.1 hypothetical protein SAMN05660859_0043 [Ancylobacter rudongensis]
MQEISRQQFDEALSVSLTEVFDGFFGRHHIEVLKGDERLVMLVADCEKTDYHNSSYFYAQGARERSEKLIVTRYYALNALSEAYELIARITNAHYEQVL